MNFDINHLRIAATLASFVAFVAVCAWAWSRRNRGAFDEAAHLPFAAEEQA